MAELDLQPLFITALLVLLFCYLFTFFSTTITRRRSAPSPPGPRGLPIVGYIPFLRPDMPPQLAELAEKYGPIFKIHLGSKLWVVITSTDLLKQVVRDQDSFFANRDATIASLIATNNGIDIVFSPNGVYWREMRKLFVRETLSNTSLQDSYELRREEVRNLMGKLISQQGESIVIGDLIYATELNVMVNLLWGATVVGETGADELRNSTLKIMDLLGMPNVSDFFPILAKFDIQGIAREMKETIPKLYGIIDSAIQAKLKTMKEKEDKDEKGSISKHDVLTILLKFLGKQLEDGSIFGIQQIKAVLLDMIIGGTDTTSTAVEWVMMELLDHPEIMKKVQDEIMSVVGKNDILEEAHLSKFHYLDAVVKETLRLHTPDSILVRKCMTESRIVAGYEIPKGSMVVLSTWSVHRDPLFWKNADEFYPERFMEEEDKVKLDYLGNDLHYLPFGTGRRACPGLPLAERMMMYLIASLVHSFEWRYPEGAKIDRSEKYGLTTRKKTPLVAVPYPRFVPRNK